jgi:ATP-binding cassette subfamily C protein LapB
MPTPAPTTELPNLAALAEAPVAARGLQGNSADSLQGCLVWLLKHYRLNHSIISLVAGLPLQNNRLTPELFGRAATRAGLDCRVVRRTLAELNPALLPMVVVLANGRAAILHSMQGQGGEATFGLINTFTDEPETLTAAQLAQATSGTYILIKTTWRTQLEQELSAPAKQWFWGTLRQFKPLYYKVGVAALVINLVALISPLFVMNIYDRVVPNQAEETLWVLAIGAMLAYTFDAVFRQLRAYFIDTAGKGADVLLASRIFSQLLNLKLQQQPLSAGALANQLRDYDALREFFTSSTLVALIDLPFMLLFVGVMALLGGPIALLPLVAMPLVLAVCMALQQEMMSLSRAQAADADLKHGHLVETINALENIKAMGSASHAQGLWERVTGTTAKGAGKIRFLSNLALNFAYWAGQMMYVILMIWGTYLIFSGALTTGALVACSMLMMRALAPISQVAGLYVRWSQTTVALEALTKFMNSPTERPLGKTFVHHPRVTGALDFDRVTFAYPGSKLVSLYQATLAIRPGEKVGVVGRAGSGKSTIARLILGLYEPQEGRVRVDGLDLSQLDPAELRQNICYFPQNLHLFRGTLRQNLLLANPEATDAELLQALELSGAFRLVRRHPLGLDLPVGERGELLSGGQRQAVGLARALMHDGRIVVLDDPTSEMDATSENWVKERLRRWLANRTLVLITHRPSMLDLVDRLVVVDDSRIIADGPKADVLARLGVKTPLSVGSGSAAPPAAVAEEL